MFEAALAQRALARAAGEVAGVVRERMDGNEGWRLLVTSDASLAISDATCHDVVAGLTQLTEAADEALSSPGPGAERVEDAKAGLPSLLAFAPAAAPIASAVAAAVPALLGVFSAHRTLTSTDIQKNDLAGAAAVAGALCAQGGSGSVVHDESRALPSDRDSRVSHPSRPLGAR